MTLQVFRQAKMQWLLMSLVTFCLLPLPSFAAFEVPKPQNPKTPKPLSLE